MEAVLQLNDNDEFNLYLLVSILVLVEAVLQFKPELDRIDKENVSILVLVEAVLQFMPSNYSERVK